MRRAILGLRRPSHRLRISMSREDKGTAECLSFARVAVATEEELDMMSSMSGRRMAPLRFLGTRNEVAAVRLIADAVKERYAKYANTYEDNVAILASDRLAPFSPQRSALIVIAGEQEICLFWMRLADILESALRSGSVKDLVALPRDTPAEKDLWRFTSWFASMMMDDVQEKDATHDSD